MAAFYADSDFSDLPAGLMGGGWQVTRLARSERGEWFVGVRRGPGSLEFTHWGSTEEQAMQAAFAMIEKAGKGSGRVNQMARKVQDFDTSTLPLFGDGHKQMDLFT